MLLHRDFYDKHVFVSESGAGLLALDTVAIGEPALDLANMIVHLELRALQGRGTSWLAGRAAGAFLNGYDPEPAVEVRLAAYRDAAWLRLACVYAYRPAWRDLVPQIVERIGSD